MSFSSLMIKWINAVIICIGAQTSGWIGDNNTQLSINEFIPPNNGYIIHKMCANTGQVIDSFGNITWNYNNNTHNDGNYYGGSGGDHSCFETSCINQVYIAYGPYADNEIAVWKLILRSNSKSINWGWGNNWINDTTFNCDLDHCVSIVKTKSDRFLNAVWFECHKSPTITPTRYIESLL